MIKYEIHITPIKEKHKKWINKILNPVQFNWNTESGQWLKVAVTSHQRVIKMAKTKRFFLRAACSKREHAIVVWWRNVKYSVKQKKMQSVHWSYTEELKKAIALRNEGTSDLSHSMGCLCSPCQTVNNQNQWEVWEVWKTQRKNNFPDIPAIKVIPMLYNSNY